MYILELFNNETVNRLQNLNPHPSKIAVIGSVEYLQIFVEMVSNIYFIPSTLLNFMKAVIN